MPIFNRNNLLKKLNYKSNYMGCRENDIIFGNFAQKRLAKLSDEELSLYSELLNCNDATLWSWVSEQQIPPIKFAQLIKIIIDDAKTI